MLSGTDHTLRSVDYTVAANDNRFPINDGYRKQGDFHFAIQPITPAWIELQVVRVHEDSCR